ncbi:MAG: HAMP domain-containing sensor histidine kinase [Bacteroidales bacterium]
MRDKGFDNRLFNKLEYIGITIVVLLFLSLLFIESRNHSFDLIAKEIQSEVTKEYNSIQSSGEKFVYYKSNLVSWSNNDIPIPREYSNNFDNKVIRLLNGYYLLKNEKMGDSIILYVSLLKNEYSIHNSYLSNSFNQRFNLKGKEHIRLSLQKTDYPISLNNKTFSYLDFSSYSPESNSFISYILSFLYFIIIFFIAKFISKLLIQKLYINSLIKLVFLFASYIILYISLHFIQLSYLFYNSDFFSPIQNTTLFVSSIGEVLLLQILILVFVLNIKISISNQKLKYLLIVLVIPASWIYFYLIEILFQAHQDIISLADIIKLDIPVFILLFKIMIGSYTIYLFIRKVLLGLERSRRKGLLDYLFLLMVAAMSLVFLFNRLPLFAFLVLGISIYILLIVIKNEIRTKNKLSSILYIIILLILFSIVNGVVIYNYNIQKERKDIVEALKIISKDDDKGAEIILLEIEKSILKDSILESKLLKETNEKVEDYFTNTYLKEINKTYSIEMLICYADELLLIHTIGKPINSKEYIDSRLSNSIKVGKSKSIFRESKGLTEKVYLAYFEIKEEKRTKIVFIDCVKKKASKEMGYPDLLISEEAKEDELKAGLNYYGVYKNNGLVLQVGNYNYPSTLKHKTNSWYDLDGYSHYTLRNAKNNTIWIASIKDETLSDKLSLPSYLFLISSIVLLILQIIINPKRFLSIKNITLSNSLQITLIGIFLISFIVFGSMSVKYFNKLTDNTNKDILIEKTQSICYSLEDYFENSNPQSDDIYYELINLSNTFLTDINIYDRKGFLLNTSRPKVFSQGIISKFINPQAFSQLSLSSSPLIYQEERIGNRDYSAAYMPIETEKGRVGYLHIPYIIQQKKIEDKILEFVSAYINVYILWITIALILSILLSNFITRPLRQLQERLKGVKLGQINEKIEWSRQDELGNLILSYNSMVDKLEESANLLKKEEREGAWREMAKQVAHDIKNPLTPMKLSIQQLQRLQNSDIVKFHERFQELSPALIEQINALAQIASEFSDYSKDKKSLDEVTDISECIRIAIEVFENQENISIIYNNESDDKVLVLGDKQQYIRIFNNLIKNAVQALYGQKDGIIEIEIVQENQECKVSIKDNGSGISKENQAKIFSSEFTTKVEGSGLGLSIVKSIIEIVGGRIDFVSNEGKGTSFNIHLPIWKP